MNIKEDFIGDIVAEDFRTAAIFKKNGIDFCCKGGRTIEEACERKKIKVDSIYDEIENLPKNNTNSIDFNNFPIDLLTDYIEKIHHRHVYEKTPILLGFLNKLCKVHGQRHPELFEVNEIFNQSIQDLTSHLKNEETTLFPFIRNMVKAKLTEEPIEQPQFGNIETPINRMKNNHEIESGRFRKIAEITNDFTPPADACNTYKVAFAMLQDFENNLLQHIHLENNILFPKAIKLEKEFEVGV